MRTMHTPSGRLAALAIALVALFAAILAPVAAVAQTTLAPAYIQYGPNTPPMNPAPIALIGQDAISGKPCILGLSATCGLAGTPFVGDYKISAANTAQTFTYTLANAHDSLSISMTCSSGTATLTVSASPDNSHFVTIDSLAAAASTVKLYTATTVGGATAISPLSFPYVQVAVGTCGASNTSTLTVGAK